MQRYIFKRILMLIPVILGVSLLVYVMMDLAPGNMIDMISGDMTEQEVAKLYHEYGYDESNVRQKIRALRGVCNLTNPKLEIIQGESGAQSRAGGHGALAYSPVHRQEVWKLYMQRLPATIKLAGASILMCIVLSIPLGIKSATKRGSLTDNTCSVLAILGLSMPNFWLGLMLMVYFGLKLHWLPSSGDTEGIKSLILPAFTVGTGLMATLMRTTRSSMLDVLRQDYLRTARSKGVPERTVINKHALRNALIPIITVIGNQMGHALGGAVVTENVFSWPGVGRMLIDAIRQRDTNTVTGCLIMTTIMISVIMLIVDIVYAFADPRLKGQYATYKKTKAEPSKPAGKEGGASA